MLIFLLPSMEIKYLALDACASPETLLEHIQEAASKEQTLISAAHQMLMSDGTINTFGEFAQLTAALAHATRERLPLGKLFIQINDQLNFRGISEGDEPKTGIDFWDNPVESLEEDGYYPQNWDRAQMLQEGLSIKGASVPGLVSEWWLQRWYHLSGLNSASWANSSATKRGVLQRIHSAVPSEIIQGGTCRANGCAQEMTVLAPFCIQRGYRRLIGFWPQACMGPALFGSTFAAMCMERGVETRLPDLNFKKGSFNYVHIFLNTKNPNNFKELLDGASLVSVSV